jgi:arsenate reductase
MTTVLFACVHNAGRSQMAASFFNSLADPAKARAISAGTAPAAAVHPEVLAAMREVGIDLGAARPRSMSDVPLESVGRLVTMGCGADACPVAPGVRTEDWPLADPRGQPPARVREIRDDVRRRVEALIAAAGWGRPQPATAGR